MVMQTQTTTTISLVNCLGLVRHSFTFTKAIATITKSTPAAIMALYLFISDLLD
jgi:hypothetical protein